MENDMEKQESPAPDWSGLEVQSERGYKLGLQDSIRRLLREDCTKDWSVTQITEALSWANRASIRITLSRMMDSGELISRMATSKHGLTAMYQARDITVAARGRPAYVPESATISVKTYPVSNRVKDLYQIFGMTLPPMLKNVRPVHGRVGAFSDRGERFAPGADETSEEREDV